MLLVALSIVPCVVMLFHRRPLLLLYLWPVMMLINLFFSESNLGVAGLAQGSVWLLPMDPVYFFTILYLGLYALLYPNRFISVLKENPFLCMFLAVVALYVVMDTPIWGKRAIGEARKGYFMFLFPLLASIVIKTPEQLRRFIQAVILSAACVAFVAMVFAATQGTILRVVNSEFTLIIAFAAFAMLIHRFQRIVVFHPMADRCLLALFAVLTIGSGQRSVWLAVGMGLLLLLLLYSARRNLMAKIALAGLAVSITTGTAFVYFPEVGARLGERFAGIIRPSSDATASWRIEGWRDELEQLADSGRLFFGEGFGAYYWGGKLGGASPHNAYIQMVVKLGLFGLLIYVLLAFQFFRRAAVFRKRFPRGPMKGYLDMGILNFGAAHAYMLGYGFVPVMFVFFAVTICSIKVSENFNKVRTGSPVLSRRPGPIRWQRNMRAHMPLPRYLR